MADYSRDDLMQALRNADKAGDTAAATAIARRVKAMDDGGSKPPPPTDNSAARGFVAGALKPLDNLTNAAMNIPGMGMIDRAGQALGLPSMQEATQGNDAARANNTRTGYQTIGNIAGTLPTAALPGGALVQGGASGALLSDGQNAGEVAQDVGIGAIGGKVGQMAARGASWLAKPVVNKGAQLLADSGVPLTLGQIASTGKGWGAKMVQGAEEGLSGLPIIGNLIDSARERGTEGFNIALGNRILGNIGQKLPKSAEAGGDMVKFVGDRLSAKYTALVPKLVARGDTQFAADIAKAKAATATLPKARQAQFGKIMLDVFGNRVQGGTLSGQALKDAESRLTFLANRYRKSMDADQSIMGDAIDEARQALRGMVARSNPAHAKELQALNKGWAELSQLRTAANSAGNATGVVTPAQALSAARKAGFRDDDFVKSAKAILPNSTPNSGTTQRAATVGLLGALGTGAAAGATITPAAGLPAAAALLYTKQGQMMLNKLVFAARPKTVQQAANLLGQFANVAPAAIPAMLKQRR